MRPSVAIIAGVALVGGVLVVRQLVASEPPSPTVSGAAQQVDRSSPAPEPRLRPARPALPAPVAATRSTDDPGAVTPEASVRAESSSGSAAAATGTHPAPAGAAVIRPGMMAIKPRPDQPPPDPQAGRVAPAFTGAEGKAQRKHLGVVVERAACRAPDFEERLAKLPAAKREALTKSCAKYNVTPRVEDPRPKR